MKVIEVIKTFAFAEQGIYVTEYEAGQVAEVSDECAEIAVNEKWAKISKKTPAPIAKEDDSILDPAFAPAIEEPAKEEAPAAESTEEAPAAE
jgi:hypothetical protein